MHLYGLIGFPLEHSFSQDYFTRKFLKLGLDDHRYQNFPIDSIESFPKLISSEPDLNGLNVTIPYKESVMPYLDAMSGDAERIGAVNTICFESPGLVGYNTDWIGFRRSLEPFIAHWQNDPFALILGAGGSAKAVAFALRQLGIHFTMVSRTRRASGITYTELTDEMIRDSKLIINTTPLGMAPHAHALPEINYDVITPMHLLYDLIYNPELSRFLEKGKEKGAQVKNGLEMLQIQAEESWSLWQRSPAGLSF